jgi:hypothetical protein
MNATDNPLGVTMAALQALGDAVSANDIEAYRAALSQAHKVGLTQAQIEDAWSWRAIRRIRTASLPPVSFDKDGEPRW